MEEFKKWATKELLTPRKIIFNVLFYGIQMGLFAYGWYSQALNTRLAGLNMLGYSVWISRGAGLVLAYNEGLILMPMLRNVIRIIRPRFARYFPADENIWFHRQIAYSMVFWAMVHTTAHYVNFINVERTQIRKQFALQMHYTQPGGITGHFMLFIMLLMYTTGHHKIKAQCFEAFWYTHHLAFFFMLGLYTHATGEYRARRTTSLARVLLHPGGVMELQFTKLSFKFVPGQWLFIQVPAVSRFQWHPFTITSAPEDPYVSVHIHQVGDFTHSLRECVDAGAHIIPLVEDSTSKRKTHVRKKTWNNLTVFVDDTKSPQKLPKVRIDGPYGAPASDTFDCQIALLIGAGIGITPFASILKHIWHCQTKGRITGSLKRVELFWVCRDIVTLRWFQSLLQILEASQTDPNFLRINIYITRDVATAIEEDIDAKYDPLTLLHTRTNFERPNWMMVYERLRSTIEDGSYLPGIRSGVKTTVNTYFCGPNDAAKAIKAAAIKSSSEDVFFSFAKEQF